MALAAINRPMLSMEKIIWQKAIVFCRVFMPWAVCTFYEHKKYAYGLGTDINFTKKYSTIFLPSFSLPEHVTHSRPLLS